MRTGPGRQPNSRTAQTHATSLGPDLAKEHPPPPGAQEERGSPLGLPTWGTRPWESGPGETATGAGCVLSLQKVVKGEPTMPVEVPCEQPAACPAVLAALLCVLCPHFSQPCQVGRPLPGSLDPLLAH